MAAVTLQIRRVEITDADAARLIAAVQAEYVVRYGGEDATPFSASEFTPPEGEFFVGYRDGVAVATAAWRWRRDLGPDIAELKRMYVVPEARAHGYARCMLGHIERVTAAAGARRLVLETGSEQPEAIGLYASSGYAATAHFGYYRDEPGVRSFGKDLGERGAGADAGPGSASSLG